MNIDNQMFVPDRPQVSITQRVYRELHRRIVTGGLRPGERLKVERLKTLLSAGASPIREALSLLTSDHLVERLDQRGFRVAEVSGAHFREILKLRCALEDMALRESLQAATPDWDARLQAAHQRMADTPREDTAAFEAHHKAFHMTLLSAAVSPILLQVCDRLYDLNIRYRYLAGRVDGYAARDIPGEHADILSAALERDADFASACLLQHYRRTGHYLAPRFDPPSAERDAP